MEVRALLKVLDALAFKTAKTAGGTLMSNPAREGESGGAALRVLAEHTDTIPTAELLLLLCADASPLTLRSLSWATLAWLGSHRPSPALAESASASAALADAAVALAAALLRCECAHPSSEGQKASAWTAAAVARAAVTALGPAAPPVLLGLAELIGSR
ncbi:hypothetical protein T492DRAFT_893126 [Pavlovales sp. CCMP2436]|nr:hypothetical protein T492DRAFT_893126 [Pavlovales sp. CCMP2436]